MIIGKMRKEYFEPDKIHLLLLLKKKKERKKKEKKKEKKAISNGDWTS